MRAMGRRTGQASSRRACGAVDGAWTRGGRRQWRGGGGDALAVPFLSSQPHLSFAPLSPLLPLLQDVTRAGLFGLGLPELAVIAGVAALIFGEGGERERNGGRVARLPGEGARPLTLPFSPFFSGPSKLPSIGKELGKTVKSFQTAAKEFETELKSASADEEEKAEKKD